MNAKQVMNTHQKLMSQMLQKTKGSPFDDRDYYATWLSQFYYFVSHATRMLTAAASRVSISQDPLHLRFLQHAGEEVHHDEYIVEDLRCLGYDIRQMPELAITSQMYQSQYYFIDYKSPAAVLGGVMYYEGLSVGVGKYIYKVCAQEFGEDCCSFVKSHSFHDDDHLPEAVALLESLPQQDLAFILENMQQSAQIYDMMTDKVLEVSQATKSVLKAA